MEQRSVGQKGERQRARHVITRVKGEREEKGSMILSRFGRDERGALDYSLTKKKDKTEQDLTWKHS